MGKECLEMRPRPVPLRGAGRGTGLGPAFFLALEAL